MSPLPPQSLGLTDCCAGTSPVGAILSRMTGLEFGNVSNVLLDPNRRGLLVRALQTWFQITGSRREGRRRADQSCRSAWVCSLLLG